MQGKNDDFFWPSYVDVMTALFAVALVIFVLSYKVSNERAKKIEQQNETLKVYKDAYERIQKADTLIKSLANSNIFSYNDICKKFVIKDFVGEEIFATDKDIILPQFTNRALVAGTALDKLIKDIYILTQNRVLVIIEGTTARYSDGTTYLESDLSYSLSYRRALALYQLWRTNGINMRSDKSELLIAGSGFQGVCRDSTEENNKRFLIQVIPKIDK